MNRHRLERSILAACMLREKSLHLALRLLGHHGCFQNALHATIWQSIVSLTQKRLSVDYVTVLSELELSGKLDYDSTMLVADCASDLVYSGNVQSYCEQLLTFERAEVMNEEVNELVAALKSGVSPDEVVRITSRVADVARKATCDSKIEDVKENAEKIIQTVVREWNSTAERGVMTGYEAIDRYLNGMKQGELHIVAARPGVGKTAYSINVALNLSLRQQPVMIYSLEMDIESIIRRMLTASVGRDLKSAPADMSGEAVIDAAMQAFVGGTLKINCTPSIHLDAIHASMAQYVAAYGPPALCIVDYLQLIRVPSLKSRWEEVGAVSRGLKALAGECRCPVLAAAQLSRESEKAERPLLSHLRESGSIEQDADVVMLMGLAQGSDDQLEVNIAKNRHGETGSARLVFDKKTQRIRSFGTHAPRVMTSKAWRQQEVCYDEDDTVF